MTKNKRREIMCPINKIDDNFVLITLQINSY